MEIATKENFKVGATLLCREYGHKFTILRNLQDGIWEARGDSGDKCVFECEASCYYIK